MSRTHFANTRLTVTDESGNEHAYRAGEIVRRKGTTDAWSDCIIVGFSGRSYGRVEVKLMRPYAYASCVGTTSPGILLGHEDFTVFAHHMVAQFDKCQGGPMVSGSVANTRPEYDSEQVTITLPSR